MTSAETMNNLSNAFAINVSVWLTSLKLSKADKMISCPPLTRQTAANSSNTRALVLQSQKEIHTDNCTNSRCRDDRDTVLEWPGFKQPFKSLSSYIDPDAYYYTKEIIPLPLCSHLQPFRSLLKVFRSNPSQTNIPFI